MMTWMKRVMFGCWRQHTHMVRERRGTEYMLVCETCGTAIPMIPVTAPAAQPNHAAHAEKKGLLLRLS